MTDEPQPTTICIARLDDDQLVLDGLELARAFFTADPSSVGPRSFDALAGRGARDQITTADITAINATMRARSSHSRWAPIANTDLEWLAAIAPDLDLLADDERWHRDDGSTLARAALRHAIGPGRGPSVATKVLHLKRPRLFPVLDALVAQMLGVSLPDDAPPARRAEIAWTLMAHLREQGRTNREPLTTIQAHLSDQGIDRSLVRVLDAILWSAHPAASLPGATRRLAASLTPEAPRR